MLSTIFLVIVLVPGRSQLIALGGAVTIDSSRRGYNDSCKHRADDFINGEADGLTKYQL